MEYALATSNIWQAQWSATEESSPPQPVASETFSTPPSENAASRLSQSTTDSNGEVTVVSAAQRLGRSPRQIQRLLQSGQLKGRKVMGPKGPEWRVDQQDLVRLMQPEADGIDPILQERLEELDSKVRRISAAVSGLQARANHFENEIARLNDAAFMIGYLQRDVAVLGDRIGCIEQVTNYLDISHDEQPGLDFITREVEEQRQELRALSTGRCLSSWWQRTFSPAQKAAG